MDKPKEQTAEAINTIASPSESTSQNAVNNTVALNLSEQPDAFGRFVLIHNNAASNTVNEEDKQELTLTSFLLFLPRRVYLYLNQGKEMVVVNASSGALQVGKFATVKAANYGISYVREFINQMDFADTEAKLHLLTIFDEGVAAANGWKDLDANIFTNIPYAISASTYDKMARAAFSQAPIVAINMGIKFTSNTTLFFAGYSFFTKQANDSNLSAISAMLFAAALKYAEYFPPVILSMQREFAINGIKNVWQNTAAFKKLSKTCKKENLAPRFKGLLENMLTIYSEETIQPKPCVLNNAQIFVENNKLLTEDVDILSSANINSKDEVNQHIIKQIRESYVKSLALNTFAKQESKRIHALIKSLGAKLSVGTPGSRESMALDVMLVSIANMVAFGIEQYILTEGHTAVSAEVKINNAHEIARQLGFELKEPSYLEISYASLWLKRPEMSIAIDQLFNSLSFTGQMANLATRVRNEINSSRGDKLQKLTYGLTKFKEFASNKKPLLFAAAFTAVPIAYAALNKYNESCDKQTNSCRPTV